MSWLRMARSFKGLSAQKLADKAGVSLNYIQRIEGGSRPFEGEIRRKICTVLGFGPEILSFDSRPLLIELDKLASQSQYGDADFCSIYYERIDGRLYCTSVSEFDPLSFNSAIDNLHTNPIRIRHAKDLVNAQIILYEDK